MVINIKVEIESKVIKLDRNEHRTLLWGIPVNIGWISEDYLLCCLNSIPRFDGSLEVKRREICK